jgi:hypothetical protein
LAKRLTGDTVVTGVAGGGEGRDERLPCQNVFASTAKQITVY